MLLATVTLIRVTLLDDCNLLMACSVLLPGNELLIMILLTLGLDGRDVVEDVRILITLTATGTGRCCCNKLLGVNRDGDDA